MYKVKWIQDEGGKVKTRSFNDKKKYVEFVESLVVSAWEIVDFVLPKGEEDTFDL